MSAWDGIAQILISGIPELRYPNKQLVWVIWVPSGSSDRPSTPMAPEKTSAIRFSSSTKKVIVIRSARVEIGV